MATVTMLVHQENGFFGASFPDFPGCVTASESLDALPAKAAEVLFFHVESMRADGLEVPTPRAIGEIWDDPAFQDERADALMVVALPIDLPGRSVRVNITMDEGLLDRVGRAAKELGESRSGFLAKAAELRLGEACPDDEKLAGPLATQPHPRSRRTARSEQRVDEPRAAEGRRVER